MRFALIDRAKAEFPVHRLCHVLGFSQLQRAKEEKARIQAEATKLAIERTAITKELVAVKLGRIGFANMMIACGWGRAGTRCWTSRS